MDEQDEVDLLCEMNVIEQVRNICHTSIVQNAWSRGQELSVHGVIYGIDDGVMKDLNISTRSIDEIDAIYQLNK